VKARVQHARLTLAVMGPRVATSCGIVVAKDAIALHAGAITCAHCRRQLLAALKAEMKASDDARDNGSACAMTPQLLAEVIQLTSEEYLDEKEQDRLCDLSRRLAVVMQGLADVIWPRDFDRPDDEALACTSQVLRTIMQRLVLLRPEGAL